MCPVIYIKRFCAPKDNHICSHNYTRAHTHTCTLRSKSHTSLITILCGTLIVLCTNFSSVELLQTPHCRVTVVILHYFLIANCKHCVKTTICYTHKANAHHNIDTGLSRAAIAISTLTS